MIRSGTSRPVFSAGVRREIDRRNGGHVVPGRMQPFGWADSPGSCLEGRCWKAVEGLLVTESQIRDDLTVSLDVRSFQVFQMAATAADHLEKAATAVVILFVRVEVRAKVVDTRCENRNLDGSAPDVAVVELVFLDDFFSTDRHLILCLRRSLRYKGSSQCFI